MPLNNPPAASAGGSALDANNNQVFPAALGVTTPAAGSVSERVLTRAGNSQFAFANADVTDIIAQPSLENYSFYKGEANGLNTTLNNVMCTITVGGVNAPVSSVLAPTFTNYTTSKNLVRLLGSATTASGSQITGFGTARIRGNAARRGGFYVVLRFYTVLQAGHRGAAGLGSGANNLTTDPSGETQSFIGLACDVADVNWQFMSKGTGAATKIDSGLAKTSTGSLLALYLYAAPFAAGVQYQLENEETQTVIASGTMTTNLPTNITLLNTTGVRVSNAATVTQAEIIFNMLYNGARY